MPSVERVQHSYVTSVESSSSSVTLLDANVSRSFVMIHNTDESDLYLSYDGTATTSPGGYTVLIPSLYLWEMPFPPYTGALTGIWEGSGTGSAVITELW